MNHPFYHLDKSANQEAPYLDIPIRLAQQFKSEQQTTSEQMEKQFMREVVTGFRSRFLIRICNLLVTIHKHDFHETMRFSWQKFSIFEIKQNQIMHLAPSWNKPSSTSVDSNISICVTNSGTSAVGGKTPVCRLSIQSDRYLQISMESKYLKFRGKQRISQAALTRDELYTEIITIKQIPTQVL